MKAKALKNFFKGCLIIASIAALILVVYYATIWFMPATTLAKISGHPYWGTALGIDLSRRLIIIASLAWSLLFYFIILCCKLEDGIERKNERKCFLSLNVGLLLGVFGVLLTYTNINLDAALSIGLIITLLIGGCITPSGFLGGGAGFLGFILPIAIFTALCKSPI